MRELPLDLPSARAWDDAGEVRAGLLRLFGLAPNPQSTFLVGVFGVFSNVLKDIRKRLDDS